MIKSINFTTRLALVAGAMSVLCLVSNAAPAAPAAQEEPPVGRGGSMAATGQKPRKSDAAKTDTKMEKAVAGASMADMDKNFLQMAAKGGMKEVHMGQIATEKGQSADVKKIGGVMVADHTKANNQIMGFAEKRGIKLDSRHSMDNMSMKDMAMFDQEWLSMMMKDHDKDIAMFSNEAKMGTDPELKAFAGKTLPVLKKHLAMVKSAQGKMMKKG